MSVEALTKENFDTLVLNSRQPVLVDFWAAWCMPCKMLAPVVEELAGEYEGKLSCYKLNIDEEPELAGTYGVMSIPTLLLFKGGKVENRAVGLRPKEDIVGLLGI